MKLTNSAINAIQPTEKEQELSDSGVAGLKIRVSKNTGTKTFYLIYYNSNGRKRKYRIGRFGDIGLPAARKVAQKLKVEIAMGRDPQEEKIGNREEVKRRKISSLRSFLDYQYYPWAEQNQESPYRTKEILERNFKILMGKQISSITCWEIQKWRQLELKRGI